MLDLPLLLRVLAEAEGFDRLEAGQANAFQGCNKVRVVSSGNLDDPFMEAFGFLDGVPTGFGVLLTESGQKGQDGIGRAGHARTRSSQRRAASTTSIERDVLSRDCRDPMKPVTMPWETRRLEKAPVIGSKPHRKQMSVP